MKDYLEGARKWVEDSADLSIEQLESVIETLGHKVTETPNLSAEVAENIRSAIKFLNETLCSMGSSTPIESNKPVAQEFHLDSTVTATNDALDVSPLVPVEDVEPVELNKEEKRRALNKLCSSGMITRGVHKKAS